jgi:L-ascorbate metabolism protein UlaG (beta-lactamase superfamily)
MKFLHVRHATSILTYAGSKILVDPVFAEKEEFPPIPLTPNKRKNPLVGLSTKVETLLDVDMILSTHVHMDHFDRAAKDLLNKNIELICQSDDVTTLKSYGFLNLIPVETALIHKGISITRVNAQHGTGTTGEMMGVASGYILSSDNEPTIYFTGDTIFNESIVENIKKYHPEILIMNAGSPKFLNSDQIVMNIMDIEKTLRVNPKLTFIIVHLNTFNHCIETREDIHEYFSLGRLSEIGANKFFVPEDNELLELSIFDTTTK